MTKGKESINKAVPSKIIYKRYENKVILIGFKNIYSPTEIVSMYGKDVAELYFATHESYSSFGKLSIDVGSLYGDEKRIYVGDIMHISEFEELVETMKIASENLKKVRKIKVSIQEI